MPRRLVLLSLAVLAAAFADGQEPPAKPDRPAKPDKPAAPAGKDGLPKAETILDGYVEATGGEKAYGKLKSRVIRGSVTLGEVGLSGKIETWHQAPDRYYSKVSLGALGETETGYDGRTAWKVTLGSASKITGPERAFFVREATFNADLRWRELTKTVETVGIEDVNGKPAYKIKAVTTDGHAMYLYYDKYSNLLVRVDANVVTELGQVDVEVYPSDYREVDGVLIPHVVTQRMIGMLQTVRVDSVEFNVKIPAEKFETPRAVKQLKDEDGNAAPPRKGAKPRKKEP